MMTPFSGKAGFACVCGTAVIALPERTFWTLAHSCEETIEGNASSIDTPHFRYSIEPLYSGFLRSLDAVLVLSLFPVEVLSPFVFTQRTARSSVYPSAI